MYSNICAALGDKLSPNEEIFLKRFHGTLNNLHFRCDKSHFRKFERQFATAPARKSLKKGGFWFAFLIASQAAPTSILVLKLSVE